MYSLYIIKSEKTNQIYIGHTNNVQRRLREHLNGSNASTKFDINWNFIYQEDYETRALAMAREKFFKTGDGRKVLKLKGIL